MIKLCNKCHEIKEFHKSVSWSCKGCYSIENKQRYRNKNPIIKRSSKLRKCAMCGETRKHKALGFCQPCYRKHFHNGQHFNFLKYKALKRDKYKCTRCNITLNDWLEKTGKELAIHHIDTNHYNNDFGNLTTLCGVCHKTTHWELTR